MMIVRTACSLAAIVLATLTASAQGGEQPQSGPLPRGVATAGMLPQRLVQCVLSHPLNLDPGHAQTQAEVKYEGHHAFAVELPAIAARTSAPPDPVDPAELVDPRTKIVFDPDHLTSDVPGHFDRVVDYWPKRVELSTNLPGGLFHVIIISHIDAAQGTAMLFMTHAADAATLDLKHVFSGPCRVKIASG